MSKFTNLAVGLLLATALAMTGCEETKCDECTECPSFLGEYYGTIESLNETCADVMLLTGNEYMNVISQTPLKFESRDSRGLWVVFDGTLCATTDEDYPMNYFFTAYYTPDTSDRDYTLDYSLIGFFSVEEQSAEVVSVTATLDLRFAFDDGEVCSLTGDVRLTGSPGQ